MVSIYLASRYSRIDEMNRVAVELETLGCCSVVSSWISGACNEGTLGGAAIAEIDIRDCRNADWLIAFTEQPRSTNSRGGKFVELGVAIAMNKQIFVVGYRENVFCCLPQIQFFEDWGSCLSLLRRRLEPVWQ
jgi:nucleoside 2-deoxyribosyltransferase